MLVVETYLMNITLVVLPHCSYWVTVRGPQYTVDIGDVWISLSLWTCVLLDLA